MSESMGHENVLAATSLPDLVKHKMGDLVTGERMAAALKWARQRREVDHITNPIRDFMQQIREVSKSQYPVAGRFLARAVIDPNGFSRGQLDASDYVPSVSADLTVAIQRARKVGAIEVVVHSAAPRVLARAVATPALLLTALDEPAEAWLPEQVRAADPHFDMQTLWARLDPAKVSGYKSALDRTPLP